MSTNSIVSMKTVLTCNLCSRTMRTSIVLSPPTYVALGGSNSVGHGLKRNETRFSRLVFDGLRADEPGLVFQDSAIGGMGPIIAGTCRTRYVARAARFATVEYLPNMGFGDSGELEAVELLLDELLERRAKVVLVEILPR